MKVGAATRSVFTLALSVAAMSGGTALAQSLIPLGPQAFVGQNVGALGVEGGGPTGPTVFQRARPDYDPLGIHLGSFYIYPSADLSESYDSNIFATPGGGQPNNSIVSDFYTELRPALGIRSDWNQHAVGLALAGDFKRYADHTTENVNNFAVQGVGRYDIETGTYFLADAGYVLGHEPRSSPSAGFGKNPVEYHVTEGDLAFVREPGPIKLRVDATVTSYSYNDQVTNTGAQINETQRDRIEYVLAPRVAYEFAPPYLAFVRFVGNERQYAHRTDQAGFNHSSHGYEGDAGFGFQITNLIVAEVYAGYLVQEYEDHRFSNENGVAFGGNLQWNVTQQTSIKASASKSIAETSRPVQGPTGLANSPSADESQVLLVVEQEIQRNILGLASFGYVRDVFNDVNRTDNTYEGNLGARYLINRNLSATADVTLTHRDSNVFIGNYDELVATVGIKLSY